MPIKLQVRNKFNLNEHAYVLSSLIYAYLIVFLFDNCLIQYFIDTFFIKYILSFTFTFDAFSALGIFYFLFLTIFLLFVLESWWGSRLEFQRLNSFWSYVIFLAHPISLYLFLKVVFPVSISKDISTKNYILPALNQETSLRFFGMVSLSLFILVAIRTCFMEKSANYYLLENWKKKTSQRFYYCWDENKDRLKALIISVSLFLTVKFF